MNIRSLVLSVLLAGPAFSQGQRPPAPAFDYEAARLTRILTATRTDSKITVNGRMDEPEWQMAEPATDFIQRVPHPAEPSAERTEARILYDDDNLYVSFI